jgi:HEAT repeat protein
MPRSLLVSLLFLVSFSLCPARAEDEEPAVAGKKLSAWLTQLQEGKDAKDRRRAAAALDLIGAPRSRQILPALVKALREDKEEIVREKAALAVGKGAAALLAAAREEKKDELPRIDEPRDALAVALRTDASDKVREAAARGLAALGGDARGAAGALGAALKDKHPGTVLAAADALRRLGKDAREAQADLLTLLADKKADAPAREDAAFTLGQIAPDARDVLPTLREVLTDVKAPVTLRKKSAESIGKLGRDASEAAPNLGAVLTAKDSPADLRLTAVTVLDGLGAEARAALPSLIDGTKDNDRYVRSLSLHAIGRIGKDIEPQRRKTVEAVLTGLDDSSLEVRIAAIEALVALGVDGLHTETTEAVKRLKELAERDTRKQVREAALAAVEKILPKK